MRVGVIDEQLKEMENGVEREYADEVKEAKNIIANADLKRQSKIEMIEMLRVKLQNGQVFEPISIPENEVNDNGHKEDTQSNSGGEPDQPFGMTNSVKQLIGEKSYDENIKMPTVYDSLVKNHPELKQRDYGSLRAQLSGILSKLTKQGFLKIYKKGNSSNPHIYRRNPNTDKNLFDI